jgi:hypothetical protein
MDEDLARLAELRVADRRSPLARSMSARSSANASPSRRPVHANSPISVSIVAARSAGRNVRVAAISTAISASL